MGNCASPSGQVGYAELRESIPGSLVSEQDFDLFYSLCKVESARAISTVLIPNQCPLFYVVVSGEVHVHLASLAIKNKSTVAATYSTGEMIHFFNSTLRTTHFPRVTTTFDFGEILRDNGVKLALHFKSLPNTTARVIGMDRSALEEFKVLARHNTHALTSFLGLSMAELIRTSSYLKTITQEQAAMFGILMKVRLSHIGGVISPVDDDLLTCQSDSNSNKSPSERLLKKIRANQTFDARCCAAAGPVSFLLHGTALAVPYGAPPNPQMQKLKHANRLITPKSSHTPKVFRASTNTLLSPLNTFAGFHKRPAHVPAIFSTTHGRADPDKDSDEFVRQHLTVSSGIMMGLSGMFCREPAMPVMSMVAASPSVVGYFNYNVLDTFFAVDPRFRRVLQRNFFMQLMTWFKGTVPLLRDMDDWSFALLSCKVVLKSFLTDSVIYKRDSPSDFAYIIVSGSIQETTESSVQENSLGSASDSFSVKSERILNTGTLFGEVALSTNNPYFSTVTTKEPTLLMCISKRVLEQIYNNNKTKLCEIRIRLLGGDAALQHVVDHPRGCQLFQAYLDKEMAGENLRFYTAVDRFDAMCSDVLNQHHHLAKACARYKRELSNTFENTDSAEGSYKESMKSYYGSDQDIQLYQGEGEMIDLENEENFDISKKSMHAMSAPSTFDTDGATRHSSFISDGGESTVCEALTYNAGQTGLPTTSWSRHNSVDSDIFIQQFASSNVASTPENGNPYKPVKNASKPVLESIISESNLPIQEDSAKFSVKYKPTPNGSLKINQVLPATEDEQNDSTGSARVRQQVITVTTKHPIAPERVVDPERVKEIARTITQKLHRIQKNIMELKQVARSIVQTYIYNGSEFQLNLPGTVRTRTEEKFKAWAATLLASATKDALASARADDGFHSLKLSIDRVYSFDFAEESAKNDLKHGNVSIPHNGAGRSLVTAGDRANVEKTGFLAVLSESSDFTPASNINSEFTPSSINYSADDYGHSANFSTSVNSGAASAGADITAEKAQIRKLSSLPGGFKASAPFLRSLGPQESAKHGHTTTSSFKPAPIIIPNNMFSGSSSNVASPLYATSGNVSQIHTDRSVPHTQGPIDPNHMIVVQVQSLDLSFVHLFTESKQEILKLLRDDKFPRFKSTQEFQQFISTILLCERNSVAVKNGDSFYNLDNSLSVQGTA